MNPTQKNVLYMLKESNAIEGVYDRTSLINAHHAWKFLMTKKSLCNECILIAHRLLMANQNIENKYKGDWRDVPVWIAGKTLTQPKIVIDSLIQDFCEDINNPKFKDVISMHIRFEHIHPFIDGNGRMGRMIMNWHSLRLGHKLLVYTAEKKHEQYYPMFSAGDGK